MCIALVTCSGDSSEWKQKQYSTQEITLTCKRFNIMYYPVVLKPSCLLESVIVFKLYIPKSHPRPLVSESLRLKLRNVHIKKTKKTQNNSLITYVVELLVFKYKHVCLGPKGQRWNQSARWISCVCCLQVEASLKPVITRTNSLSNGSLLKWAVIQVKVKCNQRNIVLMCELSASTSSRK